MNSNKILLSLLMLILLCSIVQAGAFTFTNGKGINSVCPRATALFTDNIVNGAEEQQFTVNVEGSAAVWSTAVPSGFNLLPGMPKTVYTYITPFEDAKPGIYDVSVVVTTPTAVKKITHSVTLRECYDVLLIPIQQSKNVCPNDKAVVFETAIKNTGEYQENYQLSVEGPAADWVKLSEETINIAKEETKKVYAYVNVPEDAEGNKEFTVVVKGLSRGSDTVKSTTFKVIVDPCYKFDIAATQKNAYSLCEASSQMIPVAIKNQGTVENTFAISIDGPEWSSLSKSSATLAPGQSEIVNIVANPLYKIEGDFKIDLEVVPVKGALKAVDSYDINVRKCHSVQLDIVKTDDKICNDVANTYDVIVSNDGEVNKQYKIEATGDWKWTNEDTVSVNAGEKKTATLNFKAGVDAEPKENLIKVKATAMDESAVSAEDEIKITNVDIATCYDPELIIIPDDVVIYYDSAAAIPVQIKNKGIKTAKYELALSGTAVNFVQISPSAVTVDPNDAEMSALYIAPSAQVEPKQYEITVAVRLSDTTILKTKTVKVRITENKDEATIGLINIITPSKENVGLWTRIKNWFNNLFKKEEVVEQNNTESVLPQEEITNQTPEETPVETEEVVQPVETPKGEELVVVRREMGKGDVYLFSLNNEAHSVKVENINGNKTSLTFSSNPVNIELSVGESKEIDLNNDGINDVRATLNEISNDKLDITYEAIEPAQETKPSILSRIWKSVLDFKYYILAGLVILALIIILSKTNVTKKIVDFFEEDVEEETKKEEPKVEHKTEEHHKEEKKKKKE